MLGGVGEGEDEGEGALNEDESNGHGREVIARLELLVGMAAGSALTVLGEFLIFVEEDPLRWGKVRPR